MVSVTTILLSIVVSVVGVSAAAVAAAIFWLLYSIKGELRRNTEAVQIWTSVAKEISEKQSLGDIPKLTEGLTRIAGEMVAQYRATAEHISGLTRLIEVPDKSSVMGGASENIGVAEDEAEVSRLLRSGFAEDEARDRVRDSRLWKGFTISG